MSTRPTQDDACAAMDALIDTIGLHGLEDVLDPAVAYIHDRHALYDEPPLWGRDTAIAAHALALAIRAYATRPNPAGTHLRDRIIDIIEAEWLRPFDPNDHAGDTPGARAYDAARYVGEALQDELDRRTVDACHRQKARIAELEAENARLQALADRRWVAYQSARRRAANLRSRIRFYVSAWKRLVRETTRLRAQLSATTNPARAEEQLPADAATERDRIRAAIQAEIDDHDPDHTFRDLAASSQTGQGDSGHAGNAWWRAYVHVGGLLHALACIEPGPADVATALTRHDQAHGLYETATAPTHNEHKE